MIKYIQVTNKNGNYLRIPLYFDYTSDYAIMNIEGIGQVKPEISMTSLASYSGVIVNGIDFKSRNIVLTLLFMGNDIEQNRLNLYKMAPVGSVVNIQIRTDHGLYTIDAIVESNETPIFTEKEQATISFLCPDPYFIDITDTNINKVKSFSDIVPEFEFSFELNPKVEFSDIIKNNKLELYYSGTTSTGFILHNYFYSDGIGSYYQISKENTNELMYFDNSRIQDITGKQLSEGDDLIIDTRPENRSTYLIRDDKKYPMYGALDSGESWFTLNPGINTFVYTAQYNWEDIIINMEYNVKVNGI